MCFFRCDSDVSLPILPIAFGIIFVGTNQANLLGQPRLQNQEPLQPCDTPKHTLELVGSVGNKSYYWETTANVSWINSLEICHRNEMSMASIETEAEDLFLVTSGQRLGWKAYLNLAGSDIFDEGNWRWLRSGKPFDYTNWYPGSPYPGPDGRNWNCLALDPNAPWKWVDMGCNSYLSMTLCEFP